METLQGFRRSVIGPCEKPLKDIEEEITSIIKTAKVANKEIVPKLKAIKDMLGKLHPPSLTDHFLFRYDDRKKVHGMVTDLMYGIEIGEVT